jgi:hypothetical protein
MFSLDGGGRVSLDLEGGATPRLPWITFRDVRRARTPKPFPVSSRRKDGRVLFSGRSRAEGAEIKGSVRERSGVVEVEGSVRNLLKGDRAVSVGFRFPLGDARWRWWDDLDRHREIAGGVYENVDRIGMGSTGGISRYYWSCASSSDEAVALAVPADRPAAFRILARRDRAAGAAIEIVYDFGLSKETRKFPNRADFAFVVYRCDPAWGFRSALKRYYELFPEFFVKRVRREGGWLPFRDASTIDGVKDFGLAYYEGSKNVAFNKKAGILSFIYNEPWTFWQKHDVSRGTTPEECLDVIEANTKLANSVAADSGGSGGRLNEKSAAALASAIYTRAGRPFGGSSRCSPRTPSSRRPAGRARTRAGSRSSSTPRASTSRRARGTRASTSTARPTRTNTTSAASP